MFITEPPNVVVALDARTGRTLWSYRKEIPKDLRLCCGRVNRGVAILGDSVYYGSIDAHLIALDARTGKVRWDVTMADYKLGYSSTGAPLAVKDKIISGMAGGEFGVRGFIDAYDAQDRQARLALLHHSGQRASPATRPGKATAGRPARPPPG